MKAWAIVFGVAVLAIAGIVISGETYACGEFRQGMVNLNIRTPEGKPIAGATLNFLRNNKQVPFADVFHPRYTESTPNVSLSNADGVISFVAPSMPVSEHYISVFGLYNITTFYMYEHCCWEINAPGCVPLRFPVAQLYHPGDKDTSKYPTVKVQTKDGEVSRPVYEQILVLQPQSKGLLY